MISKQNNKKNYFQIKVLLLFWMDGVEQRVNSSDKFYIPTKLLTFNFQGYTSHIGLELGEGLGEICEKEAERGEVIGRETNRCMVE